MYFLISVRQQTYTYIDQTYFIRGRSQQHSNGFGSTSTQPLDLRPFASMAYIYGFGGQNPLHEYIEKRWKQKRDDLIRSGIDYPKQW